jgi:hypothetical protein
VLTSRIRVLRVSVLGLLAVMLAGSVAAGTASATAGPFWHHRAIGGEGEGSKIEPSAPENFQGESGVQRFIATISSSSIEITSSSAQVKGAIFNTSLQGQAKFQIAFSQPTLVKPALKGCTVVIGEKNIVVSHGHLAWKWNGEKKQLEETTQEAQKPSMIITPAEIAEGVTELPKGEFTKVSLSGSGCGVLAGTFKVEGSETGFSSPSNVKEWSTKLAVSGVEGKELPQHFWNGKEFVGVRVGLLFGGNPASIVGQGAGSADQQEVAVFEK